MLRLIIISIMITASYVSASGATGFTKKEKSTIDGQHSQVMHIYSSDDPAELAFLRRKAGKISRKMTSEHEFAILKSCMLETVNDPENPGVGIAAPQVGVSRMLIAVQRFDKPGEPFEFYINPRIVTRSAVMQKGSEGCLSVPEKSGEVARNSEIRIRYRDSSYRLREETVAGFTAVIFQHEIDHLDGILFTDRIIAEQ